MLVVGGILKQNQKWIPGFEGKYFLDTDGNLFSTFRGIRKKKLIQNPKWGKAYHALLYVEGANKHFKLMKLVGKTFLGTEDVFPLDGDASNHSLSNLGYSLPEGEKWLKGFEGMYSVDQKGSVISYKKSREKLKLQNHNEHWTYRLYDKNGVQHFIREVDIVNYLK